MDCKCSQTQSELVLGLDVLQFLWTIHSKAAELNMTELLHIQQPWWQRALHGWPLDELNYNQQKKNAGPFIQHNVVSLICLPAVPRRAAPTQKALIGRNESRPLHIRELGRLGCEVCVHITKDARVLEDKALLQSVCCRFEGYGLTGCYRFI